MKNMKFKYFSHNGKVLPESRAAVSLKDKEYSYGFGVYETVRITNGVPYFLKEHVNRLIESAKIIDLVHGFDVDSIDKSVDELVKKIGPITINLKILLIGAQAKENCNLYLLCLAPLLPDKKLYQEGADFITYNYERFLPNAKTLNMLGSYLAYNKAKKRGMYDALLVNRNGFITEGTMTNFYCIKGKTIYSPFKKDILLGVTRDAVFKVARENGDKIIEKNISVSDVSSYEGAFVTSTSTKIMPVRSIDGKTYGIPEELRELMKLFDDFLLRCAGILN